MIYLYSGTPGSGKSLHVASDIYYKLKYGNQVCLCNFMIEQSYFDANQFSRFIYLDDENVDPLYFKKFADNYWDENPVSSVREKEGRLKIFIDEAQLYFNAREWQKNYKKGWTKFFSMHRHLGYDIILITQFDRSLDRQVRALIEYEYVHRKIENIGLGGKVFSVLAGGGLFYYAVVWYPQKEKVGGEFFKFHRKFHRLYDTHAMIGNQAILPDGSE